MFSHASNPVGYNVGQSFDASNPVGYNWNVTINANLDGLVVNQTAPTGVSLTGPSIYAVFPGDLIFGSSGTFGYWTPIHQTHSHYGQLTQTSRGTVGQAIWVQNYTAPQVMTGNTNLGSYTERLGPVDPVNRVVTMYCVETMQWTGYSLDTATYYGAQQTLQTLGYQFFGSGSGGGQWATTAYGNNYVQGYGGVLYCYNDANGQLLWSFGNGG